MRKKVNFKDIKDLGDEYLSEDLDKEITAMIEQVDKEIFESRVTMRWQKEQLDIVKKAASLIGIPYQIYIREIVFRKSLDDISQITEKLKTAKTI